MAETNEPHVSFDDGSQQPANAATFQRRGSWTKLRHVDSLNIEAGVVSGQPNHRASKEVSWQRTLLLAFQCVGVIYGDIGTSPLYVFSSTFTDGIKHPEDILGVLSLIIYTIIMVPLIKYVFIVLSANDNGDGGTFALYSLFCRYAKVGLIPNDQPEDTELANYRLDVPSSQLSRSEKIKEKLESSKVAKVMLFMVTILGTSMVMGDGVLTPSISVLSAVGGIKGLHQDAIVYISIAILIVLFLGQQFGTDKVGYTFAPAITLWFAFIAGIGVYNLFKYDVGILKAFNPRYIIDYFKRNGKQGWVSLGGVVLCITGTEAMFADLGHFNVPAIQISFSTMVFPSIILAYIGQAAYLTKHPENVATTFYDSIPNPIYWPTFVVAVAAAIIASQAMISGAFSIISQSLSLGCFPRVRVVHTSAKYEGQVYIPEVNYFLMVACVIVTWSFKTTVKIGNAYGIAVVAVMLITTTFLALIMLVIWKTRIWWILLFFTVFMSIELVYFSSVLYKFTDGGYLPLAFSFVLMSIMGIWHYAHYNRYIFELRNKVPSSYVRDLANNERINRLPGIGLLYSELVQGIPPIFPHFVKSIPSIHSVVVMVSIKSIPIGKVAPEERFLFRQVEPKEYRVFRCVVRYGYKDTIEEPVEFERQIVENLKAFITNENFVLDSEQHHDATKTIPHSGQLSGSNAVKLNSTEVHVEDALEQKKRGHTSSDSIHSLNAAVSNRLRPGGGYGTEEDEIQFVQRAMDQGVFYLIGEVEVVAKPESSLLKKAVIDYGYSFLRKNFRQGEKMLAIPRNRLLRVGMTYEV